VTATVGFAPKKVRKQMQYLFPRSKFADTNNLRQQITHIGSEFAEVCHASWANEGVDRLTSEILDTLHSCETALWILEGMHGPGFIHDHWQAVIKKNRDRGYYPTPVEETKHTPYRPGHDDPLGVGPCECEPHQGARTFFEPPPFKPSHEREIEKLHLRNKEEKELIDTLREIREVQQDATPGPCPVYAQELYEKGKELKIQQDAMDSTTRCPLCFERSGFHTGFCPTNKEVVK
jgi:hypothetical protein